MAKRQMLILMRASDDSTDGSTDDPTGLSVRAFRGQVHSNHHVAEQYVCAC